MKYSEKEMIEAARSAREKAYAPYSNFRVGAAVETENGELINGCNVESASYGITICAERTAICTAIARGNKRIMRIAVVADTDELTPPCGICRQMIWEFGGDVEVIMANLAGKSETLQMRDLLPRAFDSTFLK